MYTQFVEFKLFRLFFFFFNIERFLKKLDISKKNTVLEGTRCVFSKTQTRISKLISWLHRHMPTCSNGVVVYHDPLCHIVCPTSVQTQFEHETEQQ